MEKGHSSDKNKASFFRRILEQEYGILFSTWLGIFSLFVAIQAEVFIQKNNPLTAIATMPYECLCDIDVSPVKLSALLKESSKEQLENDAGDSSKQKIADKSPIYIFAMDASGSINRHPTIEAPEIARYIACVDKVRPFTDATRLPNKALHQLTKEKRVSTSRIAQLELCRYINLVPDKSRVALWTFGSEVNSVMPEKNQEDDGTWWVEFVEEQAKANPRIRMSDLAIDATNATENKLKNNTDFAKLMSTFFHKITQDNNSGMDEEKHFVIISDFANDPGGPEGFYRSSLLNITNNFQDLEEKRVTFHLVKLSGTSQDVLSILPIGKRNLDFFSYRETKLMSEETGANFDFLKPICDSAESLSFYYTPGNPKIIPAKILVDSGYNNTDIRLTLVSKAPYEESFPLKLKPSLASGENLENKQKGGCIRGERQGELSVTKGGVTCKVRDNGDGIILDSEYSLDSREAANNRLLISWRKSGDNGAGNGSDQKTYAVQMRFYKRLNHWGAICLIISMLIVLDFALLGFTKILLKMALQRPTNKKLTLLSEVIGLFVINLIVNCILIGGDSVLPCKGKGTILLSNIVTMAIVGFILVSNLAGLEEKSSPSTGKPGETNGRQDEASAYSQGNVAGGEVTTIL